MPAPALQVDLLRKVEYPMRCGFQAIRAKIQTKASGLQPDSRINDPAASGTTGTVSASAESKILRHLALYGGYLLLAVFLTYPLVTNLDNSVPMPSYIHHKPWLHSLWAYFWWLWYVDYSIFHLYQLPFFTNFIFYPVGIQCWAFLIQGFWPSLLFMPFATFFSTIAAGNLLLLFTLANAGYAAFMLARYCIGDARAAYVTGIGFAFCCPQLANAQGHILVLAAVPLMPLFILCMLRLRQRDSLLNICMLSLVCVLLMLAYWYFDLFALIFIILFMVFERIDRRTLIGMVKAGILCSIVGIPIAVFVYSHEHNILASSINSAKDWSVDLIAFFVPSQDHTLWGDSFQDIRKGLGANPTIQSAYLGYPLLLMSILAVFRYEWKTLGLWVAGFVLFSTLALGPILHVGGQTNLHLLGVPVIIPLPFLLLHKLPLFSALRDCSMFLVMSSLCLAVTAGYGVNWILRRSSHPLLVYCCIIVVLLADQLHIPFPIYAVNIPAAYGTLADKTAQGTLVDVPLREDLLCNLFYQSVHKKRLLIGSFSRLDGFYQNYPEQISFIEVLKNPQILVDNPPESLRAYRESAQWALLFFDIDTVVLHKNLMSEAQREAIQRFIGEVLDELTLTHFEQGDLIVYQVWEKGPQPALEDLLIDFEPAGSHFYVARGWSSVEMWNDQESVRWSEGATSDLYLYLDSNKSLTAEFRLFPFSYPGSPVQTLAVYLNDSPLGVFELTDRGQWNICQVDLPREYIHTGVNRFQFKYGFSQRPSSVIPSSRDDRVIGVAFDYIRIFSGALPRPQPAL